jgi:hypothetical protein
VVTGRCFISPVTGADPPLNGIVRPGLLPHATTCNGLILSGGGSLDRYHVHVVQTTTMPPDDTFFRGEGAFDILTVTGLILDDQGYTHITFSDSERALAGHLDGGCRVLSFAIIVLADTPDANLTKWDFVGSL